MAIARGTGTEVLRTHHFEYVDSPSTTSATTYKVRFKANSGTTFYSQNGNKTASLILMELAG